MNGRHSLGQLINEAVRIKPSATPTEPKSGHVTYAEMFWESLSSSDQEGEIVEELNRVMNYLLTQSKRDARTERAAWFVSFAFGRLLDVPNAAQRSDANSFLNTLCDRSRCENKTIRFRCIQCIRMALEPLTSQPEIDESVAETIFATLLARVRDRNHEVRTQALLALDRFKVPGDDALYQQDQVTAAYFVSLQMDPHPNPRAAILDCLPLIPEAVVAICARTADVNEVVRMHAWKVISMKLTPERMGNEKCGSVMLNGMCDRSDLVRRLAEQALLSWFDRDAKENLITLFGFLDGEKCEVVMPEVMETLLRRRLDPILTWSESVRFEMTGGCSKQEALFWRMLLCGSKQRGDALGKAAAMDADKAAESQSLFDLIDRLLPSTLMEVVEPFVKLLEQQCLVPCRHLMEVLIHCFNFTDEGDQRIAADLFQKLCRYQCLNSPPEWYPTVIAFGRMVWPDAFQFVEDTMSALEQISVPFQQEGHTDDAAFSHWVLLSVEMLRALPFKTPNIFALGNTTFTLADTLRILKTALMAPPGNMGIERWVIEGVGMCLTFKLSHEEHETCLPLLWNELGSSDSQAARAAVLSLSTLAMAHGVRCIDQKPPSSVFQASFPPLWECKIFEASSENPSLPIRFMTLLHWEQNVFPEVQTAVVQSLCKLLMINHAYSHQGMSPGECIQCLCPLVVIFVYEEEDEAQNAELQQILKVFFDRYAQANLQHQFVFRAGFIPILRYCLEVVNALRLSIASATKFLANLLLAPLHGRHMRENEVEEMQRQRAKQNLQLMCLLLWEIRQCPTGLSSSKAYVSSIWKVIADLRIEDSEDGEKQQISGLLADPEINRSLTEKQREALLAKLDLPEELHPLDGEPLETLKEKLDAYISQLGVHPFSEEEDDD